MHRAQALVVERDPAVRAMIHDLMTGEDIITHGASSPEEALSRLREESLRFVFVDLLAFGTAQHDLVPRALRLSPPPLIIGLVSEDDPNLHEWLHDGLFDVLKKPIQPLSLRLVVRRATRRLELNDELLKLRTDLQGREGYHRLVGRSAAMRRVREQLKQLAGTEIPVWISGEAGSGRELAARYLHRASARRAKPFNVLNGQGVTAESWHSQWLGENGDGLLKRTEGGTLYIDEPVAIEPSIRAGILDRLTNETQNGVRVLAGSVHTAEELLEEGEQFLARRLAKASIGVPPLRDRAEDVALLVRHFLSSICEINRLAWIGISNDAVTLLERHPWPGNVQELRDAVEHAAILVSDGVLRPSDLPEAIREGAVAQTTPRGSLRKFRDAKREVVERFEKAYLHELLVRTAGNVTAASTKAGMLRSALQRLLRKYNLKSAEFRAGKTSHTTPRAES